MFWYRVGLGNLSSLRLALIFSCYILRYSEHTGLYCSLSLECLTPPFILPEGTGATSSGFLKYVLLEDVPLGSLHHFCSCSYMFCLWLSDRFIYLFVYCLM